MSLNIQCCFNFHKGEVNLKQTLISVERRSFEHLLDEIMKAENLFIARDYGNALKLVQEVEKSKKLSKEEKRKCVFIRSVCLFYQGNGSEAIDYFDREISKYEKTKNYTEILQYILYKINIFFLKGNFDTIFDLVEEGEKIIMKIQKPSPEIQEISGHFYFRKGEAFFWTYRLDEGRSNLLKAREIAEKFPEKKLLADINHNLGLVYSTKGEYDAGIMHLKQSLSYFQEIKHVSMTIRVMHNLGVMYAERGEYATSRDYYTKVVELQGKTPHLVAGIADTYWREGQLDKALNVITTDFEDLQKRFKSDEMNCVMYFVLGNIYVFLGKLDEALESYQKSKFLVASNPNRLRTSALCNIGICGIHFLRGELDKALKFANNALELFTRIGGIYGIGWVHFQLCQIYNEMDDFANALLHGEICLEQRTIVGNKQEISSILYLLISIHIRKREEEEADKYLKQIEKLASATNIKIVSQNYRLSKALIRSEKSRPKFWVKAIDILEELVLEEIVSHEITVKALILLCEILLNEFSISGNNEVLDDLQTHTSRLIEIAKNQNSYTLRVEANNIRVLTLWLQAQNTDADIELQSTRRLLLEAQQLAVEKGLARLAQKIQKQHNNILAQLEKWDEFLRKYYEFLRS